MSKINYFKEQSAEWLEFRKGYITGTNVAALFQMSPYQSKNALIKDKSGEPAKSFDNEYLQAGRDLEPAVLAKLKRLGYKAKRAHKSKVCVLYNDVTKLSASLDAVCVRDDRHYIVEIKTTGMEKFKTWLLEGLPLDYILQVQTQLILRPDEFEGSALLAAFTPQWPANPMAIYKIDYNDEVRQIIEQTAAVFLSDIKGFEYNMKGKERLKELLSHTSTLLKTYNYL